MARLGSSQGLVRPLRVIRGSGESRGLRLSTRWQRVLLFLLVGAAVFAVALGARSGLQPDSVELQHRDAAALVQAAFKERRDAGADAWIYRGWRELGRLHDSASEHQPPQGSRVRGLERQLSSLGPGPDQHQLQGLLALRRAWLTPDQSGSALHEAEKELVAALESDATRASTWSDLAAVYLSWATQFNRPRLLLDAYAATHAALELEPDLSEARYNQALALEGLGLFREAATVLAGSWPGWADLEAIRRKQDELEVIDPVALRDRFLAELEVTAEAGDAAAFLQQAERFPQTARRWVEETLLPRWADAAAAGDAQQANQLLALARALGEHLANPPDGDTLADPMLREAVATIDSALGIGDHQQLDALIRGQQAFGQGMRALPEHLDEAQAKFQEAERSLAAGASPFAGWAVFYSGACHDYQGDKPGAMASFDSLQHSGSGSPSLMLRAHWGRGLVFDKLELVGSAAAQYASAMELANRLKDGEFRAALGWLAVRVLVRLERRDDAWRSLTQSLAAHDEPESAVHRSNALFFAADLARDEQPQHQMLTPQWQHASEDLQVLFREAAVEAARRGPPTALAQNELELARVLASMNRGSEAVAILDRAGQELHQVPSPETRARLLADAAMAKNRLGLFNDTAEAREALAAAYVTYRDSGSLTFAIEAGLELAKLETRDRHRAAAQGWTERCLELLEQAANDLVRPSDRSRYLRSVRSIYQVAFGLAFDEGDTEKLLTLLRQRALAVSARGATRGVSREFTVSQPQTASTLDINTTWVAYLELADGRLVALTHGTKSTQVVRLPIGAEELAALVKDLPVARDQPSRLKAFLAALHIALVEPISSELPPEGQLALTLDEAFSGIPYAGLWDETNDSYLVERFELVVVTQPDFSSLVPGNFAIPLTDEILIAAASKPADAWGLPELPQANVEADRLSRLLPGAGLLAGQNATVENLLAALPGREVFHFGGHSLADPADTSDSLLILAVGADGRSAVSLRDLEKLDLSKLRLIVLAGCQTARGGTANLARTLALDSNAIVIGSLWSVDDAAAASFFELFYSRLVAGVPPVQALRETQIGLISTNSEADTVPGAAWTAFLGRKPSWPS